MTIPGALPGATAEEFAAWLAAHGWTIVEVTATTIAVHADGRGARTYVREPTLLSHRWVIRRASRRR